MSGDGGDGGDGAGSGGSSGGGGGGGGGDGQGGDRSDDEGDWKALLSKAGRDAASLPEDLRVALQVLTHSGCCVVPPHRNKFFVRIPNTVGK
jgi:hypothetical protein